MFNIKFIYIRKNEKKKLSKYMSWRTSYYIHRISAYLDTFLHAKSILQHWKYKHSPWQWGSLPEKSSFGSRRDFSGSGITPQPGNGIGAFKWRPTHSWITPKLFLLSGTFRRGLCHFFQILYYPWILQIFHIPLFWAGPICEPSLCPNRVWGIEIDKRCLFAVVG